MPKLQVSLPDGSETSHELGEDEITIGRVPDNTLQIDDASVSSHHAVLRLRGADYILTDIGSTNGTRLNGVDIEPDEEHALKPGDTIRFGHIQTAYQTDKVTGAQAMPEEAEPAAVVASSSARPADFSNASPFQTKKKKKDPASVAILAFGIVAILAFVGATLMILGLKSPL